MLKKKNNHNTYIRMKKITLLVVVVLCSITASSQKVFSKEWKQWQLGKDSASIAKQEEEIRLKKLKSVYNFSTQSEGIAISGKLLQKSAHYQYAAIGKSIVASGLVFAAAYQDKVSNRNVFLFSGGVLAFAGMICYIKSIDYKFKSGKVLELSVGRAVLKF